MWETKYKCPQATLSTMNSFISIKFSANFYKMAVFAILSHLLPCPTRKTSPPNALENYKRENSVFPEASEDKNRPAVPFKCPATGQAVCGQLSLAPGERVLIPAWFTTQLSVRACRFRFLNLLLKAFVKVLFSATWNIAGWSRHISSVQDWQQLPSGSEFGFRVITMCSNDFEHTALLCRFRLPFVLMVGSCGKAIPHMIDLQLRWRLMLP